MGRRYDNTLHTERHFFFVCSYSHATLLDHGGVLVNHFPVCRPLAGALAPQTLRLSTRPFPASTGIEPRV